LSAKAREPWHPFQPTKIYIFADAGFHSASGMTKDLMRIPSTPQVAERSLRYLSFSGRVAIDGRVRDADSLGLRFNVTGKNAE
jgi:hypothetical protein